MYDLSTLKDRYPEDYVINMDILGNGYSNPIYVCFIPSELDNALSNKKCTKNKILKLVEKYKKYIGKDVYNKLNTIYGGPDGR